MPKLKKTKVLSIPSYLAVKKIKGTDNHDNLLVNMYEDNYANLKLIIYEQSANIEWAIYTKEDLEIFNDEISNIMSELEKFRSHINTQINS